MHLPLQSRLKAFGGSIESQRAFVLVKNGQGSKYIIQAFSNLYDLHDREGSHVSRPFRALIVLVCARTLA